MFCWRFNLNFHFIMFREGPEKLLGSLWERESALGHDVPPGWIRIGFLCLRIKNRESPGPCGPPWSQCIKGFLWLKGLDPVVDNQDQLPEKEGKISSLGSEAVKEGALVHRNKRGAREWPGRGLGAPNLVEKTALDRQGWFVVQEIGRPVDMGSRHHINRPFRTVTIFSLTFRRLRQAGHQPR